MVPNNILHEQRLTISRPPPSFPPPSPASCVWWKFCLYPIFMVVVSDLPSPDLLLLFLLLPLPLAFGGSFSLDPIFMVVVSDLPSPDLLLLFLLLPLPLAFGGSFSLDPIFMVVVSDLPSPDLFLIVPLVFGASYCFYGRSFRLTISRPPLSFPPPSPAPCVWLEFLLDSM